MFLGTTAHSFRLPGWSSTPRTLSKLSGVAVPSNVFGAYEAALSVDEIIDVRSPAEFAEDHMPGAVNLPVLSDEERHLIGCLYKEDAFTAKKRGASLVARNIAAHLDDHFASKPGNYQPLIYCWRGGSRSGSMAVVLAQIGWRVKLLAGGYKRFRGEVRGTIETISPALNLVALAGLTGVGKTALLHRLDLAGHQVLDLEGLANHRGSTLGAAGLGDQPSQKLFESRLAGELARFDTSKPVWIEAESSKVSYPTCT